MKEHAAAAFTGMDKIEIRHMLLLAGAQPLRAAIGMAKDGRAIILLDRHKPPRALEKDLLEKVPDIQQHRFGTFSADPADPKLARFVVNRGCPGLARRLVKALRGTGLRRVELTTEDGQETEAAQDEDGDGYAQDYEPAPHDAP